MNPLEEMREKIWKVLKSEKFNLFLLLKCWCVYEETPAILQNVTAINSLDTVIQTLGRLNALENYDTCIVFYFFV